MRRICTIGPSLLLARTTVVTHRQTGSNWQRGAVGPILCVQANAGSDTCICFSSTRSRTSPSRGKIPVIDYGPYFAGEPGALERLAEEVRYACENIGFLYVLNHGVPQEIIDRGFAASRRFHALPLEQKLKLAAEREQRRLHADERLGAGGFAGAQGDQAEPEREFLHQPRPRPRSSGRSGRHSAARPQPMAGGLARICAPT